MMSNVMDEYMVITRPFVDGEVFMPTAAQKLWRTSDVKDVEKLKSTRGKKVLHDEMWIRIGGGKKVLHDVMRPRNEALVYKLRQGNMRVRITKFDVDTTFGHQTFMNKYGSRDGCVLHNGFVDSTKTSTGEWGLVVYIEGYCV
jgi:hypothetical protein